MSDRGMKRTVGQGLIVIIILALIILLNIVFYTDARGQQESEFNGSRSTYSSRPFGTRAFYLLLQEGGYRVRRFEEPLGRLKAETDIRGIFIISPPRPFSRQELDQLETWVKTGGHLVIIDREIKWDMAGGAIKMSAYPKPHQWRRPHVIQPTPLTFGVNQVQLSKFASGVKAENAPVIEQVGDQRDAVLLDFPYGRGRIALLGDPYIVANNGIGQADNLTLALNLARSMPRGIIGFDEYHHGHGAGAGARTGVVGIFLNLYDYFKPTPVIWALAQLALVAIALIYSRARRFTHPLPLATERRTRSLEFVAAMANLAQKQKLHALVVENISRSLRRRLTRKTVTGGSKAVDRVSSGIASDDSGIAKLSEGTASDHQLVEWVKQIRHGEDHIRRMR